MNVEEKIIEIVSIQSGVNKKKIERTSSIEDLGMDSLDQIEIIMALEEEFGIEIPDDEAEKMRTVQEAIEYIEKKEK